MIEKTSISERRACRLVGLSRTVMRYTPEPKVEDAVLTQRMSELAAERRRFGYRRLHALLRREGVEANHKRIHRLYQAAGLAVRRRRKRHGVAVDREPLLLPSGPNQIWSMDFVFDALASGRRIKCLTIVDDFTKRRSMSRWIRASAVSTSPVYSIARRCSGDIRRPFAPTKALNSPARRTTSGPIPTVSPLKLIQAGKPTQNAYIESFNGKFRDECLNDYWFTSLAHARAVIGNWRRDYNEHRPHSALAYQTPAEVAAQHRQQPPSPVNGLPFKSTSPTLDSN